MSDQSSSNGSGPANRRSRRGSDEGEARDAASVSLERIATEALLGDGFAPQRERDGRPPRPAASFPLLGTGGPLVPDVERIAVLRGGGLGDLIFALPALDALRAAYPKAEIVLLGQPWAAPFLAARPSPVDRVMPLPVARGVHEPGGAEEDPEDLEAFFEAARAERFDLALQLHGGGRHSNPFVRRLGARVTAGLQAPDVEPLDRSVPYAFYQSEVLRDLEVASLVGAPPVRLEPRLALSEHDVAQAAACVPDGAAPVAVLHPGAGDPRRRWPLASFAAVGASLAANGVRVLVSGIASEASLTRALADAIDGATDVGGQLSLGGLAGLLARADVVISNDSGPLHLAAAVGAATVGIFWCGNLVNAGPFTRGRHAPVISWRLDCSVCGADCTKENCRHVESFVSDAPVEEARAAAFRLLGIEPGQGVPLRSRPRRQGRAPAGTRS